MTTPAVHKLRELQKSLYEKAYADAHSLVGRSSRQLLSYQRKFEASLPKKNERTTLAELLDDLRTKQFLLFGDFHTLRQSQRGLLRLLRAYTERLRTNKIVIALEMFKAINQDEIDGYLRGTIPEAEFLQDIAYATDWGFPWQNFKMILDFARARRLPVIGVNSDNGGKDLLEVRDRFAAQKLVAAAKKYPEHKIVCLIGEHHLADDHLPQALAREMKRLGKPLSLLRVLNNVDRYYFDLKRETSHNTTEYLRLKRDMYCIMNSPPWMKWHSFSVWEEMRSAGIPAVAEQEGEVDSDADLYTEDAFDVDYQFLHFVKNLSLFLGVGLDASDMESFRILFSQEGAFFDDAGGLAGLPSVEARRIVNRAAADGVHFLPRSKTVLLTNISMNNLAEASGQYLHTLLGRFDDTTGDPESDFGRRIIKYAVGMVASKILNPRRKCMELHHHRQFLRRFKGRKVTGASLERRQVATAVLSFDRWFEQRLADTHPPANFLTRAPIAVDRRTDFQVSREIGQMLGAALYKKLIANKVPPQRLARLFRSRLRSEVSLWRELTSLYRLLKD